jgi:anti-sigma B factor antagonist
MSANTISVRVEQDRAIVALNGEHEAYTADKLARELAVLWSDRVGVTVDLRQATFIDSTVVGVFLAAHRRAHEAGLAFTLVIGDETGWAVRRMLEVTGLKERLEILD